MPCERKETALVVYPSGDEKKGSSRVAQQYQALLAEIGYAPELLPLVISEDQHLGSYYLARSLVKDAALAVVLEALPPANWLDCVSRIVWLPMIDYTWKSQLRSCDPRIELLWHSRRGLERAQFLRPELRSVWFRFGLPAPSEIHAPRRVASPPVLLLHHREHFSFPLRHFLDAIASEVPDLEILLWQASGRPAYGSRRMRPRNLAAIHTGYLPADLVDSLYSQSAIYLSSRFNEGIGLCVLEAALGGCAIACNSLSTVAEYFPRAACFDLPARRKRYFLDDHYSWAGGLRSVLSVLRRLAMDTDVLHSYRTDCQHTACSLFHEWRANASEYLRRGFAEICGTRGTPKVTASRHVVRRGSK